MHNLIWVHLIISILFLCYWILIRSKYNKSIHEPIMVFALPIFGITCIFIFLMMHVKKHIDSEGDVNKGYIDSDSDISFINKLDLENETNIVPMEEALILNKSSVKRRIVVDIIKKDALKHIKLLKKALSDEDTETSHYAASAVTEIKRKLTLYLQELSIKYKSDKTDVETLTAFADTLSQYTKSGLIDEFNYIKYLELYFDVLSNLLKSNKPPVKYYVDMVNCCIELSKTDEAIKYCNILKGAHPLSEAYYMMKLKVYFELKDNENFFSTLKEMKLSNLGLTNNGLSVLRFWTEGNVSGF